jgi:2-amino-4-hydroxy-6-hydroxymethyldihydropteridine diphosphokinase
MDNVLLGLGSNLGNKLQHIKDTIRDIASLPNTTIILQSNIIETQSVGFNTFNFYNAVILIQTSLNPFEFHQFTKEIENTNGKIQRARSEGFKDRNIDIDLLLWGKTIVNTQNLQLPHPEILNRKFVLHSIIELSKTNEFVKNCVNWDFFYNLCQGNEIFTIVS